MNKDLDTSEENAESQLFLYVGMNNGILLRANVDSITGNLSDIRTRFLGVYPVKYLLYYLQNIILYTYPPLLRDKFLSENTD